jgi:GWxTD domain-containing protein
MGGARFMPRIWSSNLLLVPILSVVLIAASTGDAGAVSVRGEGDFEFYVDVASLPTAAGATLALLQIAIPTRELRYVATDGKYVAELRLSIDLTSDDRSVFKRLIRKRDTRDTKPQERDLSAFIYELDSCLVAPGRYGITVKVEDLKRRQKTLLGIIRRRYMSSQVKGMAIDIPAFPTDRLAIGDPVFVWSGTNLSSFVPNPMQIYGLKKDTLTVLVDAIVPDTARVDSLDVRVTLSKEIGDVMEEHAFRVAVRGRQAVFFKLVDLATYPAGSYRFLVEAVGGRDLYAQSGGDFDVAWELLNWQKPVRDILLEARILLGDKEFGEFEKMSLGEQESYMKAFWKKLDPTPQTAANERHEEFIQRLRYADLHFGGFTRGALSDRGYIYIRFGPPDEIIHKPVPVNRDDLSEALAYIENQYKIIVDGVTSDRQRMVDRMPKIPNPVESRASRGRGDMDAGGFEIWDYNFKGDPLLPSDELMTVRAGLRFLFVDLDGYGDYRLTGSSEEIMEN